MAHAIKDNFKLALAQLNAVVGDLDGNLRTAREARARAAEFGADLIAFTELFPHRLSDRGSGTEARLAEGGTCCLRGARPRHGRRRARRSSWACPGATRLSSITRSRCLTAAESVPCATRTICRITACSTRSACSRRADARPDRFPRRQARRADLRGHLERGGVRGAEEAGAELLIVPNGSPYWIDKQDVRYGVPRRGWRRGCRSLT